MTTTAPDCYSHNGGIYSIRRAARNAVADFLSEHPELITEPARKGKGLTQRQTFRRWGEARGIDPILLWLVSGSNSEWAAAKRRAGS